MRTEQPQPDQLRRRYRRVVALTGAGVSACSGIPTYRDDQGNWLRSDPIQHQQFVSDRASRQRYWARSMVGWPYVQRSAPNAAHHALAGLARETFQQELLALNPGLGRPPAQARPDGDADLERQWLEGFEVPDCRACGGMLMPDVVFFGGTVPRDRVLSVTQAIEHSDALLVVGSSLMVYSGFRFCKLERLLGAGANCT